MSAAAPYIPRFYPGGLPLNWHQEQTGELPIAVQSFWSWCIGRNSPHNIELTERQTRLLFAYAVHHIEAPCWQDSDPPGELEALRQQARNLKTLDDLRAYTHAAMAFGLDPF